MAGELGVTQLSYILPVFERSRPGKLISTSGVFGISPSLQKYSWNLQGNEALTME